jgi:hypothetical protein
MGDECHQIVGEIALHFLPPPVKQQVIGDPRRRCQSARGARLLKRNDVGRQVPLGLERQLCGNASPASRSVRESCCGSLQHAGDTARLGSIGRPRKRLRDRQSQQVRIEFASQATSKAERLFALK